jgi:osmotically-inducible protein OsmY
MARNTTSDPVGLEDEDDAGLGEHDGPESQGEYAGEPFGRAAGGTYGDEDRDPSYADHAESPPDADSLEPASGMAGPTGVGPRPDQSIADEVSDLLSERLEIDPADVSVRVTDGAVLVAGLVDSDHLRDAVENLALTVAGVTGVENQLTVRD